LTLLLFPTASCPIWSITGPTTQPRNGFAAQRDSDEKSAVARAIDDNSMKIRAMQGW
jgi:hypothetical protein